MADSANDHALSILKPVCSTDPYRDNLAEPFGADFEGRRWIVATDGHCMAMLAGDCPDREGTPKIADVFEPKPRLTHRASVAALKEWAGPPPAPPPPPEKRIETCRACKGKGVLDCPTCGTSGYECEDCGGRGKTEKRQYVSITIRCGEILRGILNRDLLARVLATVPADVAEVQLGQSKSDGIFFMRAPNWVGVVMPLSSGKAETKFELLEAA